MRKLGDRLLAFLEKPLSVFWVCLALLVIHLLLRGSFIQWWSLLSYRASLLDQIQAVQLQSEQLEHQIKEAHHPEFIERQARNQLDLVREGDLIFVFTGTPEVSDETSEF